MEPINRRSQEALEKLLRQAMQANDLDGAVKVRAELQKLGAPAAAPSAAQATTASLPVPVTEDILVQRPWVFAMPGMTNTVTLSRDKTWTSTKGNPRQGTWTLKEKTLLSTVVAFGGTSIPSAEKLPRKAFGSPR